MPRLPRRGCSHGWCGRLAVDGGRYCEEHTKAANREYERFGRDRESKKNYKGAWPKIRKRYIESHPFCEECLKHERLVPVEHVYHIKPLSEGGTHDEDNLMSLCKSCHSRLHAKRGDRWH